jgi:hypothetical protein
MKGTSMAMTYDAGVAHVRRKMAERQAQLILWKLRDMRRRMHRPRTARLPAEVRALQSMMAEARAAGLISAPRQPAGKRPHATKRR